MREDELSHLLVQVSLNSDTEAFKKIYRFFYTKMLTLAQGLVGSTECAEEIVDDAFVRIWKKRFNLYQVNNIQIYLYVCVKNLCFSYIERKKEISIINFDDLNFELSDSVLYPEERLNTVELQEKINRTLSQLSPQCKLVYKLVKEDGLKYREAAEVLNVPVRSVEYQIGVALRKISECLDQENRAYRYKR